MNQLTQEQVQAAVADVVQSFPFDGYITADMKRLSSLLVRTVAKIMGGTPNPKVLDIGSGPMNVTAVFARCGFQCSAVDDLSDPWHLAGENRTKIMDFARRMGIEFCLHDATYHIPFPKGTFDVVLLNSVLEHLHISPREVLNSAFEFLKPGGILVVTMPNSVNLRKRIRVLFGKTNLPSVQAVYDCEGTWRGHVREYTRAETEYIVRRSGGQVILSKMIHSALKTRVPAWARPPYLLVTRLVPTLRNAILVIARRPADWRPGTRRSSEA